MDSAGNTLSGSHAIGVFIHTLPNATLDPVFGDGVLNAAEAGSAQTLSGATGLTTPGQTVTVTLGGTEHAATVTPTGSWGVTLPPSALQTLPDGSAPVSIVVKNAAGNQSTLTQTVTVDRTPPTLTLGHLATDNILNQSEVLTAQTLTGSASTAEASRTVTVAFNGKPYSATVQANGSWSVQVPALDVSELPDGKLTVSDKGGNPATNSHTLNVIAQPADLPTIAISTVSGDDVVNAQDAGGPMTISGSTTHVTPGRSVSVSLNGKTYLATVGSDGTWSTTVPANDVQALPQGQQSITANVTDIAQNPASNSHSITVDTTPPLLEIDALVTPGDIGLATALAGVPISGNNGGGVARYPYRGQ